MRNWPPLHDYRRSRAVVMGTWDHTHLPAIPAAGNSVERMAGLLTGPLCGWPPGRVQVLANERSPGDLPYRLVTTFEDVVDIALFYYVGHGQVDMDGELCLSLAETRPEANLRAVTSLPFQAVRRALLDSAAAIKIVILDCGFSGMSTRTVADLAGGTGAYTITASGAFGIAWFEAPSESDRPQTIFTKYLADLVEAGIPGEDPWLRMGRLFARLRENLARDRRPIPQQRDVNGGRDYVFAHNAASDVVARADPVIVAQAGRSLPDVCSDAPSDTDMIGAVGDVEILADLIAAADTSPPLAIALIGDWGAGKSSVMLQVQRQVDLLAEIARSDPEASAFASNVRQVTFNAWDYSDDRVWCGIIEHLFAALAADPGTAVAPGPDEVRAERVVLRKELAGQEAEEQRLASALRAADRVAPSGFLTGPGSPAYLWRVATVASLELARDMRAVAAVMTWWIVLGAAAYEAWLHWGALIGSVIAVAVAVIAPVSALARQLWRWDQAGLSIAIRLRRSLDERQRAVSRSVADLRERLALIDASARLSAFLRNRVTSGAYQEQGGLVGQVRRDLARLSDDLAGARDEWAAGGSSGPPPLERIVLYIDDLDRCPPQRVVEVLEAVHLMLALELFVVVVAVDVRWLIRSLEFHYRELFNADSAPGEMPGQAQPDAYPPPATPADYLDKIFQIPYVITAPTPGALGLYMQSLLPRPASAAVAPEAARQTSGSADPSEKSDEAPGRDEGMRAADPALSAASPQRLRVSQHEIDFMTRLGPLLSTPRAAKRLVNLYRLVRTGIPHAELAAFTGSGTGGPYQAVQVLLAILVGRPTAAHRVFTEIMCAPPDSDVLSVLADISVELGKIAQQVPLHGHVEEYHRWCPVLARYSFHTRPDQWSR